ncbi:hypothetical protein TWF696_001774 [Orbilia brochopaga]|uniref:Nucleocapsid protein n=1 Tax=Orbilia brochopaga TaxID=3140254 RepID=A0AAV9U6I2_9PEZI
MATINLPDVILSPGLGTNKTFYIDAHTIALIDPYASKPASLTSATRGMSVVQAIALLLTMSPGESVAVHTRLLPHRTIITYARNTTSTPVHDRHADQLMRYLANAGQLNGGNGLRDMETRYRVYTHILGMVARACQRKVLNRMRKLKDAMVNAIITASKYNDGPALPADGEWQDAHYATIFSLDKLTNIQFNDFETILREKTGHKPDDPTWCVASWLTGFAGHMLVFDVNKVPKKRETDASDCNGKEQSGKAQESNREKEYFQDMYDLISACATVVKAKHAEVAVEDREVFRRMCKVAEYAVAMGKVLEAVAGRKTEYVVREVCSPDNIHGWFPKDAHCMLSYYCDSIGVRKCTADQLYEAFRHPNNFPSDQKPYGMFNQISFCVHPELTLAVHLAAQNQQLPNGKANMRIGISKRSCWFCEHWLMALGELLDIIILVSCGYSGKKVAGWRTPLPVEGVRGMEDFLEMVDMKLFRKTSMKVRALLGHVWGEVDRARIGEQRKVKKVERSPLKGLPQGMAVVLEDANDALVKWIDQNSEQ